MSEKKSVDWESKGLHIRLLFIGVTMLEILGTVAVAALMAWLLDYLFKADVEVHPLIWLVLCSIGSMPFLKSCMTDCFFDMNAHM